MIWPCALCDDAVQLPEGQSPLKVICEKCVVAQLKAMIERGWSYCRIAKRFGKSSGTIRKWCLAEGLKSKHKPVVRRRAIANKSQVLNAART